MFRVTAYAEDLLDAIGKLDKWPDKVRLMQSNWIGKSQGARFRFEIVPPASSRQTDGRQDAGGTIEVFTTRPDTLFGASFVALAPDHPLTKKVAMERPEVAEFIARAGQLGTSEAELLHSYPTLRAADLANAWTYVRAHPDEIEQQFRDNEADT